MFQDIWVEKLKTPPTEKCVLAERGHAEGIRLNYDPAVISYTELLYVFFATHNPTTLNRQGNDVGTIPIRDFLY